MTDVELDERPPPTGGPEPLADGSDNLTCPECGITKTSTGKPFTRASLDNHVKYHRRKDAKPKRGRGKSLKARLTELIGSVAGLIMIVNPYDGQVISEVAPRLADDLDGIAQHNPRVKAALESAVSLAENAGIGATVAAIAIPIAANHGIIPRQVGVLAAGSFGVSPPPEEPVPGIGATLASQLRRPRPAPGGEVEPEPEPESTEPDTDTVRRLAGFDGSAERNPVQPAAQSMADRPGP